MRFRSLSRTLKRIVAGSLAAACASQTTSTSAPADGGATADATPPVTIDSELLPMCEPGGTVATAAGFTPGAPVDWIAVRTEQGTYDVEVDGGVGSPTASIGEQKGTRCGGATDVAACEEKIAAIRKLQHCGGLAPCSASYFVYTRGDEVGALVTDEELAQFLAPIDTKEEAFYLAQRRDSAPLLPCTEPVARYKLDPSGGVELVLIRRGCVEGVVEEVTVHVAVDGSVTEKGRKVLETIPRCSVDAAGRRPAGLRRVGAGVHASSTELGAFCARAAHLEAASIVAFEKMSEELARLGAPAELLRAIERARRDEVRHARTMTRLAKRFGAKPAKVSVDRRARDRRRSLLAIAVENAREGCVRETFGAALALRRAETLADDELRAAMRAIAVDELRHAELSWEVAAFLETKLSERQRAIVRRRFEEEIATLAGEAKDDGAAFDLHARISNEIWSRAA